MPSLRERKRYLAFEILSEKPITDFGVVSRALTDTALGFLGQLGCAEAGMMVLKDKYDAGKQRGLIRVNNRHLDKLRATLALVQEMDGQKVIVRSIGASGIIKKASARYLAS